MMKMKRTLQLLTIFGMVCIGLACKKDEEKKPLLQEGLYEMRVENAKWDSYGLEKFLKPDNNDFWGYARVVEQDNGAIVISFSDASIDNGISTGHKFFAKKKDMHLLREGALTGPTFDLEWSSVNNAVAQGLLLLPEPIGGNWGEGLCYSMKTYKVYLSKVE
jgi:hypothetical protein